MTTWFTSDTHWNHKNVIKYCDRPWESVEEMNEGLIKRWNARVEPKDHVYHLGDFAFAGQTRIAPVLERLNGKIHLIKGNHDYHCKKQWFVNRFEWIKDYYELRVQDSEAEDGKSQRIVLCHFPLLTWHMGHRGAWHFHGHCHGSINELNLETTRLDVGCDSFNWEPKSYEELKEIMLQRVYKVVDHHDELTL